MQKTNCWGLFQKVGRGPKKNRGDKKEEAPFDSSGLIGEKAEPKVFSGGGPLETG